MNHNQPRMWEQWKVLTRQWQAILTSIEPHQQAFFDAKKKKWSFFPQTDKSHGMFNPWCDGPNNAMDTSASLSKATTKADKEHYKKEGRCFFYDTQGHISCTCPKKPPLLAIKATTATIMTVTIEEQLTKVPSQTQSEMTQENVLRYLQNLSDKEYQQMAIRWGKMTSREDFGQA